MCVFRVIISNTELYLGCARDYTVKIRDGVPYANFSCITDKIPEQYKDRHYDILERHIDCHKVRDALTHWKLLLSTIGGYKIYE